MSTPVPAHQSWHDSLPASCTCDLAYSERGLVDDRCYFHRLIEAVVDLREASWQVDPPMATLGRWVREPGGWRRVE